MTRIKTYTAKVIPTVRGIGDASSGTIAPGDLQLGMYLNNEGSTSLNLYNTPDGTGQPWLQIAPNQLIGQIVGFNNGPNGLVVGFTSDAIDSNSSFINQALNSLINTFTSILPGGNASALVATANFSDLVNCVFQDQITTQKEALAQSDDGGFLAWLKEYWYVPVGLFSLYEISNDYRAYKSK